jgi:hypothetical protein
MKKHYFMAGILAAALLAATLGSTTTAATPVSGTTTTPADSTITTPQRIQQQGDTVIINTNDSVPIGNAQRAA